MKYTWKIWKYVFGLVVIVIAVLVALFRFIPKSTNGFSVSPSSGPEGTEITVTYPKTQSIPPAGTTVKFTNAGEHGYYAVNNGAATYVAYDTTKGSSYNAAANAATTDANHTGYTATVPSGICGLIIQSAQLPPPPPKEIAVSLVGPDGKEVAGMGTFGLVCDRYTLNIKIVSSKDPVLPDGADQSTITATLSVTGPAQFINGTRVKPSDPKISITTPLGLVMVHFDNSLGTIVPSPANVKTDFNGDAVATVSSADAGIDKVQAIASGIGDAIVNVHFEPKITGVKEDFVQPVSPTNYQIATIPANPKDLTFDWAIIRPAGPVCGSLTGPASGLGQSKNGFFHGPTNDFPNGCDEKYEMATMIKVTVTDKDGQSDSKTFSARAFEGKGLVKLP